MRNKIVSIVDRYNMHRKPEINAELICESNNEIKIKFSGSFCEGCGINDYFDDFVIEAEEDLNLQIIYIKKEGKKNSYVVKFCIKN